MSVFTAGVRVRSTRNARQTGTVEAACSRPPGAAADSGPWYRIAWDGSDEGYGAACDLEVIA